MSREDCAFEKGIRQLYNTIRDDAKRDALQILREKCLEHQDFHKGDDGKFRAYISIEDLDYIINEVAEE